MNHFTQQLIESRLPQIGRLGAGSHGSLDEGACAMEWVSYLAGEPFSDSPACTCPVIGAFVRAWNDGLPDGERDEILRPLLHRLIGTRNSALEERRALMAADWLVRTHTPAWLRLAGLTEHANALASLPEITDMAQVPSIRGPLEAARKDAGVAGAVASDAAWAALEPTKRDLQASARELLVRMIEVQEAAKR